MRFSELVLTFSGLFLDLGLLASCLVDIFPGGPILLVLAEVLQDCFGRDEEEGGRCDGIACLLGLIMGIFERIDVLGDALYVQMVVMHFILQGQHIEVMESDA